MKSAFSSDSRSVTGFTLIELMTVMGVFAVVAAMIVPCLNKSNSLTGDGSKLVGVLDVARQKAITNNSLTAVAILTEVDDQYRGITILEMSTATSSAEWVQTHKWETFSPGIAADTNSLPLAAAQSIIPPLPKLRYKGKEFSNSQYKVVIFRPGGKNPGNAGVLAVQLFEGTIDANGHPIYARPNGASANYFRISVLPTGRLKIDRNS